jgi:starch phosphorylase
MLGGLDPEDIDVQLYADPVADSPQVCVTMQREGRMHGVVNGYIYRAAVPAQRQAEHYTPRIVPHHPDAFIPMESTRIAWHG